MSVMPRPVPSSAESSNVYRPALSRPIGLARPPYALDTIASGRTAVVAGAIALALAGSVTMARADEALVVELTLASHVFSPAEIKVPANKAFTIVVKNTDDAAEEFDSNDLKIEKVIAAKSSGSFRVKPLKPGKYTFAGEYHENTAHGVVIAE